MRPFASHHFTTFLQQTVLISICLLISTIDLTFLGFSSPQSFSRRSSRFHFRLTVMVRPATCKCKLLFSPYNLDHHAPAVFSSHLPLPRLTWLPSLAPNPAPTPAVITASNTCYNLLLRHCYTCYNTTTHATTSATTTATTTASTSAPTLLQGLFVCLSSPFSPASTSHRVFWRREFRRLAFR